MPRAKHSVGNRQTAPKLLAIRETLTARSGRRVASQIDIRRPFAYFSNMAGIRTTQRAHGRAGGKAKTSVKSLAARQNALLRWRGKERGDIIPQAALIADVWYRDKNAGIALWSAGSRCFLTFECGAFRPVLVRRKHGDGSRGSFAPIETVGLICGPGKIADTTEEWVAIKSDARKAFHGQAATGWRFLPPTGGKDELVPFEAPATLSL